MATKKASNDHGKELAKKWIAQLTEEIDAYAQARVNDSWKGAGDPLDVSVIEAELAMAHARLQRTLAVVLKEFV